MQHRCRRQKPQQTGQESLLCTAHCCVCPHQAVTISDLQSAMHAPAVPQTASRGVSLVNPTYPHEDSLSHPPADSPDRHHEISPSAAQSPDSSYHDRVVACLSILGRVLFTLPSADQARQSLFLASPSQVPDDHLGSARDACGERCGANVVLRV